ELAQLGIAAQSGLEGVTLIRRESAQHVKARLFLLLLVHHIQLCKLSRNFNMPRRIRAFTVPKGSLNLSAISACVSPLKNASSIACRWSGGRLLTVFRISEICSVSKLGVVADAYCAVSDAISSLNPSMTRARLWRERNRSIARLRVMLTAQ